jgi:chemotaxis protein methyltransferase CheR
MTDQDFDFIRKLLQERSAIVLDAGKRYLVEARLAPLVRQLSLQSISELVGQLRSRAANGLQSQIVEAMVTTETSFFRDHHPFESLRKAVIPDLVRRRSGERRLNIWCAATASGQEPYSVALLLREYFSELASWRITLLASDLSKEMLARTREGRYSQLEVNRGLPAPLLVKYFHQEGATWQLSADVRRLVELQEINLAQPWPYLPRMDLVLLRNVMIYFNVETKKSILGRLARLLKPDGYLLLGGAETTVNLSSSFRRVEELKGGFYQLVE